MFTGMFGACLGLALQTNRRWLRIFAPIVGIALAIAAHMLNNSLPLLAALAGEPPAGHEAVADVGFLGAFLSGSLIQLVVFLPFLLIVGLALWRSSVWERRHP
jgi:protease PrsW